MDARAAAGVSTEKKCRLRSATDLDLVRDHRAFFIAHCFDVGDGESPIAQILQTSLQSLM